MYFLSSDVEPPWIQCPRDIIAGTDERRNTANVSWNVPIATDNSDEEVRHLTKAITVCNPRLTLVAYCNG